MKRRRPSIDIFSNKSGIYIQGRPVATSPRCKVEAVKLGETEWHWGRTRERDKRRDDQDTETRCEIEGIRYVDRWRSERDKGRGAM